MRVLSLTQPWATLVAIGAKQIETRSWGTSYRGPLAIHAAKGWPKWAQELCYTNPFYGVLLKAYEPCLDPRFEKRLPTGCIVATCNLLAVVPVTEKNRMIYGPDLGHNEHHGYKVWQLPPPEPEHSFGDYTPGRHAWLLGNVRALAQPLPHKGAQGLRTFQWPENKNAVP